ncbi:hypothetical protein SBRV1_gp24 [Sulfolobales Beppu rod-shaped virus 1]|uniref:Uncharacterized protein n=1 Tax=Sulfolobales Beppu rod-shaped virus 1 TaxID=2493121 RepID=A0A3Q8Q3Y5_9VIRU|nr:hypothetical protein QIT32_gp24 [Sulfolobales Beppu rod-shaped virus 1]AZI75913.1 hypothetical protein SBRV1_gp24 [Sulfolobales Beppu rod-shaped virus 1]
MMKEHHLIMLDRISQWLSKRNIEFKYINLGQKYFEIAVTSLTNLTNKDIEELEEIIREFKFYHIYTWFWDYSTEFVYFDDEDYQITLNFEEQKDSVDLQDIIFEDK